MNQKDKQLLLKDLCARFPYGVKVLDDLEEEDTPLTIISYEADDTFIDDDGWSHGIEHIKPYLRPMSSMTEEEKVEYCNLQDKFLYSSQYPVTYAYELFDWLNEHHFDYRGLIEKGLVLEAKDGMYNSNKEK